MGMGLYTVLCVAFQSGLNLSASLQFTSAEQPSSFSAWWTWENVLMALGTNRARVVSRYRWSSLWRLIFSSTPIWPIFGLSSKYPDTKSSYDRVCSPDRNMSCRVISSLLLFSPGGRDPHANESKAKENSHTRLDLTLRKISTDCHYIWTDSWISF